MNHSELMGAAHKALEGADFDRATELFHQVDIQQSSDKEIFDWILVLSEALQTEDARGLMGQLKDETLIGKAEGLFASWDAQAGEEDSEVFEPVVELPSGGQGANKEWIDAFLRFFGGRRDVYARAWYDDKRRRSGYHPVDQPLTQQVVQAHVEGRLTIGQYLLDPEGCCSFGVIDLDLSGNAREELRTSHGPDASPLMNQDLRNFLIRLVQAGERLGLPLVGEDSGGKGAHVWAFFAPRRAAKAVRAVLSQVVTAAGAIPACVSVELFPKQEKLGPKGLSSLVKLPFGRHPATLRQCNLLDDLANPIEDAKVAMAKVRAAPVDVVDALVGRRIAALPAPELISTQSVPKLSEITSPRSMAELLRAIDGAEEQAVAIEKMLSGCQVLAGLVKRAFETHRLSADESRGLIYTLGLVGASNSFIDEVLAAARVSTLELGRVRKGLPSPSGCNKLRGLVTGTSCECFVGKKPLPYASPTLFAVGQVQPAEPRWKPFAEYLDKDASVLASPLESLAAALERIEMRMDKLEGSKQGPGER